MEFQKVLVFLQSFLLGAVLARRDKIVGGAEKLARPYLNLMREKQAQVVEEVELAMCYVREAKKCKLLFSSLHETTAQREEPTPMNRLVANRRHAD